MIDALALMIEVSSDQISTLNIIGQALGAGSGFRSFEDVFRSSNNSKEFVILKQILERY